MMLIKSPGSQDAGVYTTIGSIGSPGNLIITDKSTRDSPIFELDAKNRTFSIRDKKRKVLRFSSDSANLDIGAQDNAGNVKVNGNDGQIKIHLDGASGDISLHGADCAEDFNISGADQIEPGTVLTIDNNETLRPCENEYDKKVAGVVSGGGGLAPGIVLGKNQPGNNKAPVALIGRAYVKVDAKYSPIEVGDLLTTAKTHGHAMKAVDSSRAFGAVIGKAMQPLHAGQGLILVLIALQ